MARLDGALAQQKFVIFQNDGARDNFRVLIVDGDPFGALKTRSSAFIFMANVAKSP